MYDPAGGSTYGGIVNVMCELRALDGGESPGNCSSVFDFDAFREGVLGHIHQDMLNRATWGGTSVPDIVVDKSFPEVRVTDSPCGCRLLCVGWTLTGWALVLL
jgi:hypothetical protein